MSGNLHKKYFKDYFRDGHSVQRTNRELLDTVLEVIPCPVEGLSTIRMKVLYPGLVTGVGLPHEEGIEGEFKLGMHFDWTYGMPIIFGSSVKGVLSAFFKYEYKGEEPIDAVMMDIFGSAQKADPKQKAHRRGEDMFFDAVVVSAPGGHPLADDSITPHGDVFEEPTPLPFLKIAPGCVIEFRFKLRGKEEGALLSKEDKIGIFKSILEKYGIGAKTNVGYGQLIPV